MFSLPRITIAFAGLMATALPVAAADIQSAYTTINLDECMVMHADDFGASFACPGFRGYPLYVAEGDLRFFVSYGWNAPDEMAARQTLPQFNYVNDTLEWRLTNESGDYRPFATILRWILDDQETENDNEILVVTKIEPGNTCHVAYIDTSLISDANAIARQWADTTAPEFDCETDEVHLIPS